MSKVKVKLLRPLLNREVGSEVEYDKADAERLEGYGAVQIIGPADKPASKAKGATPQNKAEGASPNNKVEGAAPARKAASGRKPKGK